MIRSTLQQALTRPTLTPRIDYSNVLDFGSWSTDIYADNLSFAATERFHKFLPESAQLQAGEKLYLYASFLGRRVDAA